MLAKQATHLKVTLCCHMQVVDAAISESVFNMLEGCVPEFTEQGYDRPPSGSTISGTTQVAPMAVQAGTEMQLPEEADVIKQFHPQPYAKQCLYNWRGCTSGSRQTHHRASPQALTKLHVCCLDV